MKRCLNKKMETMDPEELRRIQEEKFLKELDYVFEKSLFHRKKFERGFGLMTGSLFGLLPVHVEEQVFGYGASERQMTC